jgi:hypothetical protein
MRLLFFEIYKRCLYRAASVELPKHAAHYCPQIGLSELLTDIQHREVPFIRHLGTH